MSRQHVDFHAEREQTDSFGFLTEPIKGPNNQFNAAARGDTVHVLALYVGVKSSGKIIQQLYFFFLLPSDMLSCNYHKDQSFLFNFITSEIHAYLMTHFSYDSFMNPNTALCCQMEPLHLQPFKQCHYFHF